jgi:hypothetical protein
MSSPSEAGTSSGNAGLGGTSVGGLSAGGENPGGTNANAGAGGTNPSGGSAGSSPVGGIPGDATETPSCGAPTEIDSEAALLALISGRQWQAVSLADSTLIEVSGDVEVTETLVLDGSSVPVPESIECDPEDAGPYPETCVTGFSLRGFPGWQAVPGAQCLTEVEFDSLGGGWCEEIEIAAGTKLRLQTYVREVVGLRYPVVAFVPACTVPCEATEYRCAENQLCFTQGYEFCRYCSGREAEECACETETEVSLEDGTECEFDEASDWSRAGICDDGYCTVGP